MEYVVIHGSGMMFSLSRCEEFTSDAKKFTFLNFVVIVFVGNSEMGYIQSLVIFFTMIKVSRYQATLGWYICG